MEIPRTWARKRFGEALCGATPSVLKAWKGWEHHPQAPEEQRRHGCCGSVRWVVRWVVGNTPHLEAGHLSVFIAHPRAF